MKREHELQLLDRCIELARAGQPVMPAESAASVDVARYHDPAVFEREREHVFRTSPNLVAHASQLPEPGAFLTLELLGLPLLLVREDERIRAFLNVCRHRGARLELRESGTCKRFVCPYHAWTYDRCGELVHLRHREGFPALDPSERALASLPCFELGGFVFVIPNPKYDPAEREPEALLDTVPASLRAELEALGEPELESFACDSKVWRANWKLIADGGLESYHFKVAHRGSIAKYFLDTISTYEFLGPHTRSLLPRSNILAAAELPEAKRRLRNHCNVLYSLFPSASLLVQADHIVMIVSLPTAVDETLIQMHTLAPKGARGGPKHEYWAANHQLTVAALAEDFELGEQIQAGLTSGANDTLLFGRFEAALAQLHREIDARLGG